MILKRLEGILVDMITCTFEKGYTAKLRHVVVHALVEKDGAILLGKRSKDLLEGGKWGIPGGFLDRDETAEEGVLRELREETGWSGEVVSLFRVNTKPYRPGEDRQNVVIEFIIKPIKKVAEGDHESSKIEWIPIDKLLPFTQYAFDHGESIDLFVQYLNKPFKLPLIE
ncbi:NUDIX hydrolase [Patescibacteria group bacterium]